MKLSVKQVAQKYNITIKTLHYYDSIELLQPSSKNAAGYRQYSNGDLRKLDVILLLKSLGVPLAEIKNALEHSEQLTAILEEQSENLATDIRDYEQVHQKCEKQYILLKTNPTIAAQLIGTGNYDDPLIQIIKRKPKDWWAENYPLAIEPFSIQKYRAVMFFPLYKWGLFFGIMLMTLLLLQSSFVPFGAAIILSFISYALLFYIIINDQSEKRAMTEQAMVNTMNRFDVILERNKLKKAPTEPVIAPALQTIADFAAANHTNSKTLHYYDEIGLLQPAERNEKGYRLYGIQEQQRLDKIIALKFFGFSLETIQQLLDHPDNKTIIQAFKVQKKVLKLTLEHLKEQYQHLQKIIKEHQINPIKINELQTIAHPRKWDRILVIPYILLLFLPLFFPKINLLPFLYYLVLLIPTYLLYKNQKEKG